VRGGTTLTIEVRSAYRNAGGIVRFQKKSGCASGHYALVGAGEPVSYEPDLP
jgi:hypothetical protein